MNRTFAKGANQLLDAVEAFLERSLDTSIADDPRYDQIRQAVDLVADDTSTGFGRLMTQIDDFVDLAAAHGWGGTIEFEAMDIARDEARAATLVAMTQMR